MHRGKNRSIVLYRLKYKEDKWPLPWIYWLTLKTWKKIILKYNFSYYETPFRTPLTFSYKWIYKRPILRLYSRSFGLRCSGSMRSCDGARRPRKVINNYVGVWRASLSAEVERQRHKVRWTSVDDAERMSPAVARWNSVITANLCATYLEQSAHGVLD